MSTVGRVRDAMIAEPRALPGTASAQEAGEVLSPAEVRAVYVVDDEGGLTGVLTRKTLVAEGRRRRPRPTYDARSGASPRCRSTRSTPIRRSTTRSGSWRRTTPSASLWSSTAGSSASSRGASWAAASPRTKSRTGPRTRRRRGWGEARLGSAPGSRGQRGRSASPSRASRELLVRRSGSVTTKSPEAKPFRMRKAGNA